jgi:hypothetical protein
MPYNSCIEQCFSLAVNPLYSPSVVSTLSPLFLCRFYFDINRQDIKGGTSVEGRRIREKKGKKEGRKEEEI